MDFHFGHDSADRAIAAFKDSIEKLEDILRQQRDNINNFQNGGFKGQVADEYIANIRRKMDLIEDLRHVYQQAISKLRKAKSEAENTDDQLQRRLRSSK